MFPVSFPVANQPIRLPWRHRAKENRTTICASLATKMRVIYHIRQIGTRHLSHVRMQSLEYAREVHPCERKDYHQGAESQQPLGDADIMAEMQVCRKRQPSRQRPHLLRVVLPPVSPAQLPLYRPQHKRKRHHEEAKRHKSHANPECREYENRV